MIRLEENKLTRLLFYTKDIEVKSFAVLPKIMKNSSYQGNTNGLNLSVLSNCYLIISRTGSAGSKDYKSKMYTMSLKNRRITQRFFSSILSWMEDPAYETMYYYNEDQLLEFNLDYKDFEVKTPSTKHSDYMLEARPTIYEDRLGRYEGVAISFNRHENEVILPWGDFVILADIVLNFNFEVEALLLFNSFIMSCQLDRVTTPEQERLGRRIDRGSKDPFR